MLSEQVVSDFFLCSLGSGIFVTPALVAMGTGSLGGSLFLWAFGGIIATCGLLVWLQLGLSLPLITTDDGVTRAVPRSGGEKNYLEFIYYSNTRKRPKHLVKCMYGISFVLVGNLSGNAIAFGIYVMSAAGYTENPPKGPVIGLAVMALTLTVVLHMISRRSGIYLNNAFALGKVLLLLALIVMGFMQAAGYDFHGKPKTTSGFETQVSFSPGSSNVPSISDSLLYVVYAYSGFEQPFYVLTEVRTPRKIFPRYTLIAMSLVIVLFVLVNAAYFCAVAQSDPALAIQRNMATVFFSRLFPDAEVAQRVMAGFIAASIFGNLLVMTYTASRVKQEIAKEGILPWSMLLAKSHRTVLAWWQSRGYGKRDTLEQSPMGALLLHLGTSVLLIAVTAMLKPSIAYSVLVTLYSYVIIVLNGFFTSAGLLYLKLNKQGRDWSNPNFNPPYGAVYAGIYFLTCGFMLFAALGKPEDSSPFSSAQSGIQWYLLPAIGLSVPLWGVLWYGGLRLKMWWIDRELVVERVPRVDPDESPRNPHDNTERQYVMTSEDISSNWVVPQRRLHGM
ncbi:amino acid/polyamine transporter I [Rhypophila decipiens]|uniref:Amino acid/polyamine transporter I n=1 Tax=Rhypophila decipiens TaxID=261697 RepID=A0AAN7B235_9PEZI|nr:amino acid/polyamine transporter I [Rhypophila decipiens]